MSARENGLRFGPLGKGTLHLCVDMQNMFGLDTDWHTPSMAGVLPNVVRIVRRDPARTVFTRFVPPPEAGASEGAWRRYYEHWDAMTLSELAPDMVELMAPLPTFSPPAEMFDKHTYAPWSQGDLDGRLRRRGVDTLVVTGGETDVCALGAVLGAVDRGYRVVVAEDAMCSASDAMHDAVMLLYRRRYDLQIEAASTDEVLGAWPDEASISPTAPTISGAVSRSTNSSGDGSITAMSVTNSVTGRAVPTPMKPPTITVVLSGTSAAGESAVLTPGPPGGDTSA